MKKIDQVIPALDDLSLSEVETILPLLAPHFSVVKIGLELFLREGKNFVQEISSKHKLEIFLDLKLHDIPNTVSKAIRSLEGLPLKFLTIHASGGEKMMAEAKTSQQTYLPQTELLAVTLLTSLAGNEQRAIYQRERDLTVVTDLLKLGNKAGISAFVCAASDLENLPHDLKTNTFVTPGIRFKDDSKDDQARVITPKSALDLGASFLVMGRSLVIKDKLEEKIEKLRKELLLA
jgi:orotidine-5'-phosphate decarboxylase